MQAFAERRPILSYLVLCFGFTWSMWFAVPLVAGEDWALGKIAVGIGFGPALAAIVLDRARGAGGPIGTRTWWTRFAIVFLLVGAAHVSTLLTGDALSVQVFATRPPAPGATPLTLFLAALGAAVAAFVFACLAGSKSRRLGSIVAWRQPWRWWLVAALFTATWMLLGLAITASVGEAIPSVTGGLPVLTWSWFVLRSFVFTVLVVAVGEEAGWRGWMLPELQKRFSPLLSSVFLGVAWGLWHLPLYVIGQYSDEPVMVLAKAGACVILATLFTWLYNRSGGPLILAVVLHASLTTTPRMVPPTEGMGLVLLAVLVAAIVADRMWRKRP